MIRSILLLPATLALLACERAEPPPPTSNTVDGAGFDNAAAPRSIMQPKVIAEIEPEPMPEPAPPPPPTAGTVTFARGAMLDDAARSAIDALLAAPGLPDNARWVLRGSSDTGGSDAANLATSRRRAEAVRDYLIEKGKPAERIEVIALGDGRAIAPNVKLDGSDDPAGRARNRRVDIEIVAASPPASEPTPSPSATPTP